MATHSIGLVSSTPTVRRGFSVTSSDPTDVFRFNVGSSGKLNLSLRNITFGGDADLRLYRDTNSNGVIDFSDQLVTRSLKSSNGDEAINVQASPGSYLAQVNRFGSSPASVRYDFAVSTASPNNLLPQEIQVGNLSSDVTRFGSLNATNTSDVYAFSLSTFKGVNLRLSGLTADADIKLYRDSNRNGIAESSELVGSSSRFGSAPESISNITRSGSYLLQVNQFSGNTNYQATFDQYSTPFA
jgi:Bacterial pre-peptidase C-terminal domain